MVVESYVSHLTLTFGGFESNRSEEGSFFLNRQCPLRAEHLSFRPASFHQFYRIQSSAFDRDCLRKLLQNLSNFGDTSVGRRLEDRIRALCLRISNARNEDEARKVARQLRSLLREHLDQFRARATRGGVVERRQDIKNARLEYVHHLVVSVLGR